MAGAPLGNGAFGPELRISHVGNFLTLGNGFDHHNHGAVKAWRGHLPLLTLHAPPVLLATSRGIEGSEQMIHTGKLQTGLTVVAALFMSAGIAGAEPLKVRSAYIIPGTNIMSIFNAKAGVTKHQGKSYVMDAVRFQGTPLMITALAVGEIDVALLGFSSLSLGVENAGMTDLRVFADEFRDGVKGFSSNEYMVRADSGIQKVSDLKGKVLATNAVGSAVDIAMRGILRKAGLEDKRDYTVVESGLNTMKSLLLEKKVDLVVAVPPFLFDPELRKNAKVLFTQRDAMGPSELGIWAAKDGFLKKNRAAVIDMMEDTMRVTRWLRDPKNHDEAVKIVSDFAKAPPALYADWLFTEKDYYRDPELKLDIPAFQSNLDVQRDLGFFKSKIDVKKYVDTSYIEEARKRLQ